MKNFITSVLLLSLSSIAFGQQTNQQSTDLKKNKIAVVTGSYVVIKNGLLKTEDCFNERTLLDEEGRMSKQIITKINNKWGTLYEYHYNKCSKVDSINKYEIMQGERLPKLHTISVFDDSCRLIKTISTDSTNKIVGKQIAFEYNNSGKKIKETHTEGDKITAIIKYSYTDKCVEKSAAAPNGTFLFRQQECFDEKGNLIKLIIFDVNGKKQEEATSYEYENGNIVSEKHFDNKGKLKYTINNEYDSDNLLEESITRSAKNPERYEIISTKNYRKTE